MELVVTEQRRGQGLKLNLAVMCNRSSSVEKTSDVFNINDLANVRFKYVYVVRDKFRMSLSLKKYELAKDSIVNVDIRSEVLNYSQQWTCTEHWIDWQNMGDKNAQAQIENCMFVIPINITVIKGKSFIAENIFDDSDWTDFILTATDGSVAFHKACLAAHSDVFKTMLSREWKETAEGRIQLDGVTLQTLKYLKQYMYLGTVPDDEDGLRRLLLIANCYLIDNLKAACVSKLAQNATSENLEDLLDFAIDNKFKELVFAILQLTPDKVVHEAYQIKGK